MVRYGLGLELQLGPHELHFSPPGWYSAPKAMRTMPHCARMGSPAQICRRIARQKNVVCWGLPAVACGVGENGWRKPAG